MASSNLKLSDTSYTNKEFQELYPELLEKAKELSYKWDPTVSNESDPGVTLIKEIAIALDKINYTSDKNALETMPLSVTQERTARQLFQLLGYYPKWYISAEADVSMAWKVDSESEEYETLIDSDERVKIPAFTEIKDDSGDYVYTIPTTTILKANGDVETVRAIQGVVKDLKINNTTNITLDLIDQNNRVYFPDYNVAQNGIFIMNKDAADSDNVSERTFWEQRDNLYVEEPGNRFYSFNIDISTNRCYVEFPTDIVDLIGGGLSIKYLISSGRDGNSAVGQLNQLYNSQVTATYLNRTDSTLTMDSDNLYIQNTNLEISGKDPESIDDMYKNYNRIKGTFDTIVTLRDYNNAVYNTGAVSNAVVTDRTNDVQQAYRMMASTIDGSENMVYMPQGGEDRMHPFALKIYALQYNDLVDTESESQNKKAYDTTFQMYEDLDVENPFNIDSSLLQLTYLLNDERCIQHDFSDILKNRICLLKNVAEISMMVFPNVQLTELQKRDVIDSIKNTIYLKYNARKVNFGEEIDYDTLFSNILTSSPLIKNISLNQIQYYTYALYYSEDEYTGLKDGWKQVCVSDEYDYINVSITSEDIDNNRYSGILPGTSVDVTTKGKNVYFLDPTTNFVFMTDQDNNLVLYSTKRNDFRYEILAKNILAGITPLFVVDKNDFSYALNESNALYPAVEAMDIETQMVFDFNGSTATYYPKENEVIQFVRPQLTTSVNYGTFIKYDYVGATVEQNQNHKLVNGESLVIYYKTEDSEDAPYTKVCYGDADDVRHLYPIISPTFNLVRTTDVIRYVSDARMVPTSVVTCRSGQSINIKEKNEVKLDKNNYIYVIGDEIEENGVKKYKLELQKDRTQNGITSYSITLQGDQQVVYAQDSLAYLNIVGSGTKVTVEMSSQEAESVGDKFVISNKVVSLRNISRFGVQALKKDWKKLPYQVTVLAQEFINVQGTSTQDEGGTSEDSYVKIESSTGSAPTIVLDRNGITYENTANQSAVHGVSGTVTYQDSDGISQMRDISTDKVNQDNLFTFMNSEYYQDGDQLSYSDQVTFTPEAYIQTSIDVYVDGVKTSVRGIKTDGWKENGVDYYFIINGAKLYLVKDLPEGPAVASIQGYTSSTSSTTTIDKHMQDGVWAGDYEPHSSEMKSLAPGKALIVGDATNSQTFGNNFVGVVASNDGQTTQENITFSLSEEQATSLRCYLVDDFYNISSIEFDYNSSREGANTVYKGLSESSGQFATSSQSYNVILICKQVATGKTMTVPLRQTTSQFIYTYDAEQPEICTRDWEYTDSSLQRTLISSSQLQSMYDFYSDVPEFDPWAWVLRGAEIQLNVTQDYLGDGNRVNPSLYTFKYRNRGGEEETIVLDDEADIGWSIYGLAYTDTGTDKAQKIYPNQTVTIYQPDADPVVRTPSSDKEMYVYSSEDMYVEGYKKQNTQMVNTDGEVFNPEVLISESDILPASAGYSKDNQDKEMTITKAGDYHFSYVNLPDNQYVFKITNYYKLSEFTFSSNAYFELLNAAQESAGSGMAADLSEKRVYYFSLKKQAGSGNITIDLNVQGDNVRVLITPMKPVKILDDSPFQDDTTLQNVKNIIKKLATYEINETATNVSLKNVVFFVHDSNDDPADKYNYLGKDMFDYLYEPSEDRMILNPLKSATFNNINHFYNPFTICKIVTYDALGDSNIFISQ